ncbi:MAG: hypothetical protein HRU20_15670 [Pseudomonadales bacterium]|nr:hypothetical protein [Pseudomonadales bacterium]
MNKFTLAKWLLLIFIVSGIAVQAEIAQQPLALTTIVPIEAVVLQGDAVSVKSIENAVELLTTKQVNASCQQQHVFIFTQTENERSVLELAVEKIINTSDIILTVLKDKPLDVDILKIKLRYQILASSKKENIFTTATAAGDFIYQASMNAEDWSGSIQKNPLSATSSPASTSSINWAEQRPGLKALGHRNIITWHPKLHQSIAFELDTLAEYQHPFIADLSTNTLGEKDTQIISRFHKLITTAMGPVIHAKPVFLGLGHRNNWHNDIAEQSYKKWRSQRKTQSLWVAANDAQLHVLDDKDGQEIFTYIPAFLASEKADAGLHALINTEKERRYYLDATPAIYDAYIDGQWKTLATGAAGAGGKGIYVLHVNNAELSETTVLWEFVHPDLGHVFSSPVIGKMKNGRWAVLVNNGYGSASNKAILFVLYLDAELSDGWTEGVDYHRITTSAAISSKNGLSAVTAVNLGADHSGVSSINRAYAGDLSGRVWVFDLDDKYQKNWKSALLFQAEKDQPITKAIEIYPMDTQESLLLLFGTGKFIDLSDREDVTPQSFYAVKDAYNHPTTLHTRRHLQQRGRNENGNEKAGWYVDFKKISEKLTAEPYVRNEQVYFQTLSADQRYCSAKIINRLYQIPIYPTKKQSNTIERKNIKDALELHFEDVDGWTISTFWSQNGKSLHRIDTKEGVITSAITDDKPMFEGVLRQSEIYRN